MSLAKQIVFSLLVVVLVVGGWYAYQHRALFFGGSAAEQAAAGGGGHAGARGGRGRGGAIPVVAGAVDIDATGDELTAIGTLTAAREVQIFPQVTGIVTAVDFTPGSHVEAGQTLIRLDDGDQKVAVDRAKIALDDANAALARSQKLAQSSNISAVALNAAKTAAAKAQIDLRSAELDLAKRTLKAPFAGTAGLTDISAGDLVTTSKLIVTLDDVSTLTVEFQTPERFTDKVRIGTLITVTADALPGRKFDGKIVAIDNRIEQATRTLKMKASLPNDAGALKPGMAVNVDLTLPGVPHPAVPSLAIQWDRQGSYVWKLDKGTVSRVGVTILTRHGQSVVVLADLKKSDQVITEGVQSLRPGAKVTRVDEEVATDGAGATAKPPAGKPPAGKPSGGGSS